MTYNKAETRYFLVNPILRAEGYDDHQWLKLETPVPDIGGVETAAGPTTFFGAISVQTIPVGFRYFRNIEIITA